MHSDISVITVTEFIGIIRFLHITIRVNDYRLNLFLPCDWVYARANVLELVTVLFVGFRRLIEAVIKATRSSIDWATVTLRRALCNAWNIFTCLKIKPRELRRAKLALTFGHTRRLVSKARWAIA